jgi:quaternary ammonium compound-resistance protein SugE
MAWIYLFVAGLLEIVWATAMKQSLGFSRLLPSLIMLPAMLASFWLLAIAMRSLPLGTAYVVWTGIGALGTFLVGALVFGEPLNGTRMLAAVMIVAGLLLMQLSGAEAAH